MATTQNTYTGNGSLSEYSFTFPYLEESDVRVSLDGVDQLTTAYSFANATTISFNTAPANGVAIRIYRQTSQEAPPATFFAGSAIRASDLNDNFLQQLYVAQETDQIARNLTAGEIAPGGITNVQLADDAVTTVKIADLNVTTAKINNSAVTSAKINDSAVTTAKIVGGAVTEAELATDAVTTTKIADGAVTSAKIADATIVTDNLADSAVTSAKIASGTIVDADVNASAAIADSKLTGTTCKVWVNFNGSGTVAIRASYNVSSITDNGVGDYTVNFTTAMLDANYAPVFGGQADQISSTNNGNVYGEVARFSNALQTSSARLAWGAGGESLKYDPTTASVAIFR